MPTVDGVFFFSDAVAPPPTGGGTSSSALAPRSTGAGTFENVDVDVPPDVVLLSGSPDPVSVGGVLTIAGLNLDMIQALYIDGVSTPWQVVSSTQINVPVTSPLSGLKEIYAESV